MAISFHPENKFAFLFSGSANGQYVEDLRNVATTLIKFCGYLPGNIYLVAGETVNEFDEIGHPDPNSIFQTSGLIKHILSDAVTGDFTLDLDNQVSALIGRLGSEAVAGFRNSVFFYFTGTGDKTTVGPAMYNLLIAVDSGGSEIKVNQTWLSGHLNTIDFTKNNINILMQQSYSYGFFSGIGGVTNVSDLSLQLTFTSSCDTGQVIAADTTGSAFTKYWAKALQFGKRTTASGDIYADQENTNTAVSPNPSNAENMANFLVSVKKAFFFAKWQSGLTPMFEYKASGTSEDYLGLPSLLIRDGVPYWWESPDIFLTHEGIPGKIDDLYIPDPSTDQTRPYNNTVNVVFRNIGTHPVRAYSIGIQLFRTPLGGTAPSLALDNMDIGTILNPTRQILYDVFSNTNKFTYIWDAPFYEGYTHECIKAKVQIPDSLVVLTWNVLGKNEEAQRNTDVSSDPPRDKLKPKPGDMFRGSKRHIYVIRNPFNEPHTFTITTTPEYKESLKLVNIRFFVPLINGKRKNIDFKPDKHNFNSFTFDLKGGEDLKLMGEFGFKNNTTGKKARLPLEILINKKSGSDSRKPMAESYRGRFSAIAGLSLILANEPANLKLKLLDKKGLPMKNSSVIMMTVNGFESETLKMNQKGEIILKSVNPDIYRIKVPVGKDRYEEHIIRLSGLESKELTLKIGKVLKKAFRY